MGSSDTPPVENNTETSVTYSGTSDSLHISSDDSSTTTTSGTSSTLGMSSSNHTLNFHGDVAESDITKKVDVGVYTLDRPFTIRPCSKQAERLPGDQEVKLNDIFIMDFVVYDSRSGITDKTNAQVAEGIKRLVGKNVQFRHINPKDNPYSLMGEVGKDFKILDKIDPTTHQPYMQIEFPLKIEVTTSEHISLVEDLMEIQKTYTAEEDYESRVGCSLGWVETAERFLPYEVSITPFPRCNECRHVNQSGRLLSSTAERETDSMKKDRTTTDTAECDCGPKESCAECKSDTKSKSAEAKKASLAGSSELPEREDVIVGLNVENRQLRSQVAELGDKLVNNAKNHDEQLTAKEAELQEVKTELAELKEKLKLAETLPIRKEIAEGLMGLEAEEAEKKIESLASMTAENLLEYKQDLERVAQNTSASSDAGESPILADASGTVPTSSGGGVKTLTAEEEAKAYMAEVGIEIGPRDKPRMW